MDHSLEGPDHVLSLNPDEFKQMVQGIRKIERALGSSIKKPTCKEQELLYPSRRGIKASGVIKKGETITKEKIKIIKPASGLSPEYMDTVIGKHARKEIVNNEPIERECIQ